MAQAPKIADTCKLSPDLVLCSPAVRTWSTAICYFQQLHWDYNLLKITPSLYEATLEQLTSELQKVDGSNETVFLFGHNPGFNYLISFLAKPHQTKLNMVGIPNLVTSGRVVMQLDVSKWKDMDQHCGSIIDWRIPTAPFY